VVGLPEQRFRKVVQQKNGDNLPEDDEYWIDLKQPGDRRVRLEPCVRAQDEVRADEIAHGVHRDDAHPEPREHGPHLLVPVVLERLSGGCIPRFVDGGRLFDGRSPFADVGLGPLLCPVEYLIEVLIVGLVATGRV